MDIAFFNTERTSPPPKSGTSITTILLIVVVTVLLISIGFFAFIQLGILAPPEIVCCRILELDLDFDFEGAGQ